MMNHGILMLASALALTNCQLFSRSEVAGNAKATTPFATWCASHKLSGCDGKKANVPEDQWGKGLDIFEQVARSDGGINLTRAQFNADSVRTFLGTFGGEALLKTLEKLPWDTISYRGGVFTLNNESNSTFALNGYKISGKAATARFFNRQVVLSGLNIAYADGNSESLVGIDLSTPGFMNFVTSSGTISNVPFSFVGVEKVGANGRFSPGDFIGGISKIVADKNVNWQKAIQIVMPQERIGKVLEIGTTQDQRDNDMILKAFTEVVDNLENISVGGAKPVVLNAKYNTTCNLDIGGVPILGSIKATLRLPYEYGISSANVVDGETIVKIYGLETSLGNITELKFKGDSGWLQVGRWSIPIDLSGKPNPNQKTGIRDLKCQI